MDFEKNAKVFKAFCDPNRLMILNLLRTGEKCACILQSDLDIPQSTLSHHMKVLCDAGIVIGRKEGKWIHYSTHEENSRLAVQYLNQLLTINGECDA